MNKSPILFATIAFAVGILSGSYFQPFIAASVLILFSIGMALFFNFKSKNSIWLLRNKSIHYYWIFLLFISLGIFNENINRPAIYDAENDILPPFLEGVVKESEMKSTGCRMIVDMKHFTDYQGRKIPCGNLKTLVYDVNGAEKGDIIRLPSKLVHLDSIKILGESSFYNSLKNQNIQYRISTYENELKVISHEDNIISIATKFRDKLAIEIEKSKIERNTRNFLISILLGDRSYLDYQTKQKFSHAGVAHILALSGLHIGILASILLFLTIPLNLVNSRKLRYLIVILILWIYAFLSGLSIPTLRATIMISIALIAFILERKNGFINALSVAVFIILLIWPRSLDDVGFILSITSVGFLVLLTPKINFIDHRKHPATYNICNFLIGTMVVTIATWVITAKYFNFFPAPFLIVNIIILPLLPFFISLGLLYLLFINWGLDLGILRLILEKTYSLFDSFINYFSEGSNSYIFVSPPLTTVILWISGLLIISFALYQKKHKKILFSSGASILLLSIVIIFVHPEKNSSSNLMIDRRGKNVAIAFYKDNEIQTVLLPKDKISLRKFNNQIIGFIDGSINEENFKRIMDANILIITDKSQLTANDLAKLNRETILIFNSIYNRDYDRTMEFQMRKLNFRTKLLDTNDPFLMRN